MYTGKNDLFQLPTAPVIICDRFENPHDTYLCENCWKNIMFYNLLHINHPQKNKFDGGNNLDIRISHTKKFP